MNQDNNILQTGASGERTKMRTNILIPVIAILGVHAILLGALLLQGCKDKPASGTTADNSLVTNLPSITFSNPPMVDFTPVYQPPVVSNPPVVVNPVHHTTSMTPPPVGVGVGVGTVEPQPMSSGIIEHKIESGESFATIAKKYGVSVDAIIKANPNVNPRRLQIGQIVKVPEKTATVATTAGTFATKSEKSSEPVAITSNITSGSKVYVVKSGDNLTKIAKSQGVKVSELKAANNLSTDRINVGQKLKIPVKNTAPITNPPTTPATDNLMNTTGGQPTNV
ncbi:MAG TPA: LysM peptidoglycan-binding domain-containing protein [Verrucomicrobiota bacterium]|nr:LysM peptidoglycan-binding domain-containing protein [Verrucomicrobiota bacterium]